MPNPEQEPDDSILGEILSPTKDSEAVTVPYPSMEAMMVSNSEGALRCKFGCDGLVSGLCPTCHEPFCEVHASEADNQYCTSCLTPERAAVLREPLIDAEGFKHNGEKITPVGPAFKTTTQRIFEMNDDQLAVHVDYMKQRVKDLAASLEYCRIDLSIAELELGERNEKLRKRLRGVKVTPTGTKIAGVGSGSANGEAKPKARIADPIERLAAAFGVPPERAKEFFSALAQAQAAAKTGKA